MYLPSLVVSDALGGGGLTGSDLTMFLEGRVLTTVTGVRSICLAVLAPLRVLVGGALTICLGLESPPRDFTTTSVSPSTYVGSPNVQITLLQI